VGLETRRENRRELRRLISSAYENSGASGRSRLGFRGWIHLLGWWCQLALKQSIGIFIVGWLIILVLLAAFLDLADLALSYGYT
jgi:hypothetical protein